MDTIREKLKHGFGQKKKSMHTSGHPSASVSASGSKPDKSKVEDPKHTDRKSRKTQTIARKSINPSAASSSQADHHSRSHTGSVMERRKKKSTVNPRKTKSLKVSKTSSIVSNKAFFSNDNTVAAHQRRSSKGCDSAHEGRLFLHTTLDIHIDQLFKLLFSASDFFKEFQAKRQTTDLQLGEWKTNNNGQKVRVLSMTLALQGNIGPKSSKLVEEQIQRRCSHPGELYSVDVTSIHEGIPYADVFNVLLHYCLVDAHNNTTELMAFANVNFIKPTWAVIKTFIMKHSLEGLSIYFSELLQELQKEIAKSKRSSSRQA